MGRSAGAPKLPAGGMTTFSAPGHQPGVSRRRLHHRAAAGGAELRRRRGRLGLLVPLLVFFLGPAARGQCLPRRQRTDELGRRWPAAVWCFIVRPIAVGGMLVGACFTLFRMRKSLGSA